MAGTDVQYPVYILAQPVEIRQFYGDEVDRSRILQFKSEVLQAWEVQPHLSTKRKLDMIVQYVGPEVRQEIACMDEVTAADPLKVLNALVGIFGDRRSPPVLLQEFLSTKQRTGETARRFSYRVKTAFDALVNRQRFLSVEVTMETLLTDHFVENLNSGLLRSYLRERMHESVLKFSDVRQIAVRWESEEELIVNQIQTPASTSIPQPSSDTIPHSPVFPTPCPSTDLITAALSELTKKVTQLAGQMKEEILDPKDRPQVL